MPKELHDEKRAILPVPGTFPHNRCVAIRRAGALAACGDNGEPLVRSASLRIQQICNGRLTVISTDDLGVQRVEVSNCARGSRRRSPPDLAVAVTDWPRPSWPRHRTETPGTWRSAVPYPLEEFLGGLAFDHGVGNGCDVFRVRDVIEYAPELFGGAGAEPAGDLP